MEIAEKPDKGFFDMLISNSEKEVRDMAQNLLTFSGNKLFELKQFDLLQTIMDILLALMPEELSKNWLKIHQYLSVLFKNSLHQNYIVIVYL